MDASSEEDREQKNSSSQALDVTSKEDFGQQVMENELKNMKEQAKEGTMKGNDKDEDMKEKLVKEEMTTKEGWINWWRKQWKGSGNLQAEVHPADDIIFRPPSEPDKITHSQNKVSGTGPPEATDEAEEWPDKKRDDTGDREGYTRDKDLEGSHVLHNTKYRSEVLLGMKTSVSAVKSKNWNPDQYKDQSGSIG